MPINKFVSTQYQGLYEEAGNPQNNGINATVDSTLIATEYAAITADDYIISIDIPDAAHRQNGVIKKTAARDLLAIGGIYQSKNLLNILSSGVSIGFFPSHVTGALNANASYNTSEFIPVSANTQYSFSPKHQVCWYDADKSFISGSPSGEVVQTLTSPASAAYVRCSFGIGTWAAAQVEQGGAATSYEKYGYFINFNNYQDGTISGNKIENYSLSPQKVDFLKRTRNLFNKLTATIGFFLSPAGAATSNAAYCYSYFIEVNAGESYICNKSMRFTTYYDEYRNGVGGGSSVAITSFTVPSGVRYVRCTFFTSDLNNIQLESGTVTTSFVKYGFYLDGANGESITLAESTLPSWFNKSWASIGDSITAQGLWQSYVENNFKLTHTNFGVGGTLIADNSGGTSTTCMCSDTRINAIPTTMFG